MNQATGYVKRAYGNLLSVVFDHTIRQGEVGYLVLPPGKLPRE